MNGDARTDGDSPPPPAVVPTTAHDLRFRLWRLVEYAFYVIVLLVLLTAGGQTIIELAGRNSLLAHLRAEVSALQSQLVQPPSATTDTSTARSELFKKLQTAKETLEAISMNALTGTSGPCRRVRNSEELVKKCVDLSSSGYEVGVFLLIMPHGPDYWSNEALYLVLAVTSGGIGALVAGLRTAQITLLRDLSLGFAAGFIVFLAMKGGKYVFLLSDGEVSPALNPYTYALAGVLVGLFTERAYSLLSSLVDELERRLKGAVATDSRRSRGS